MGTCISTDCLLEDSESEPDLPTFAPMLERDIGTIMKNTVLRSFTCECMNNRMQMCMEILKHRATMRGCDWSVQIMNHLESCQNIEEKISLLADVDDVMECNLFVVSSKTREGG